MKKITEQDGFTLMEVLIAMLVLTIGILGIASLQIQAIEQNGSAFDRSRTNSVALAVLEELKRIPFDDTTLSDVKPGSGLDAGKASGNSLPSPGDADHEFDPNQLGGLSDSYTVDGDYIVDGTGRRYQVFWNVEPFTVTIGTDTFTPYSTIRLFAYWTTPQGPTHIEVTTVKYNNIKV